MNIFNEIIAASLPYVPKGIVRKVSSRYIAGATLDDAVQVVTKLNALGAMATVDVLGEFIHSAQEAETNTRYACSVIERLFHEKLQGNLSIKLTSLGLGLDTQHCETNVRKILDTGKSNGNMFIRFDMENSPYTSATIELYRKLRKEYSNCGVVLQAYLKRTQSDIQKLLQEDPETNVRLCKGIYVESSEIAFKDRKEIQNNYLQCLEMLFEGKAYVGIATHDDLLIDGANRMILSRGLSKKEFEFQMLLGVREHLRDRLIADGNKVRIYVPFGSDWYGYSIRRLKENPSVAGHVFKAMFMKS